MLIPRVFFDMSKSLNAVQYNFCLTTGAAVDKFADKSGNFPVLCINSKPNMNVSIFETKSDLNLMTLIMSLMA